MVPMGGMQWKAIKYLYRHPYDKYFDNAFRRMHLYRKIPAMDGNGNNIGNDIIFCDGDSVVTRILIREH